MLYTPPMVMYSWLKVMIIIIIFMLLRHVHGSDHVVETTALPDHLIRGAPGQIAFEESGIRVSHV